MHHKYIDKNLCCVLENTPTLLYLLIGLQRDECENDDFDSQYESSRFVWSENPHVALFKKPKNCKNWREGGECYGVSQSPWTCSNVPPVERLMKYLSDFKTADSEEKNKNAAKIKARQEKDNIKLTQYVVGSTVTLQQRKASSMVRSKKRLIRLPVKFTGKIVKSFLHSGNVKLDVSFEKNLSKCETIFTTGEVIPFSEDWASEGICVIRGIARGDSPEYEITHRSMKLLTGA